MRRQLWILADAVAELEAARAWYEGQRPGLGDDFLGVVETAVESLLAFPEACPVDHRDARRCLLERFPYCLYYRVDPDDVVVVALIHAARDPSSKRRRLRR